MLNSHISYRAIPLPESLLVFFHCVEQNGPMKNCLLFLLYLSAFSLTAAGAWAQNIPPAAVPPIHPATEATMRRFFQVCHFVSANREAMEKQFEIQHKTLPSWYPPQMWTDSVQAVEDIDVVSLAVPIYQRYWSEESAQSAIRLFVTPAGQAMTARLYGQEMKFREGGDSPEQARRKAEEAQRATEDAEVHKMLDSLTPQEKLHTEAFIRSEEWARLQRLSPRIAQEFRESYQAKQTEVMAAVAKEHEAELQKAVDAYRAAHPEDRTFDGR